MSSTATGVMRGERPPPALQRAQADYVIGEQEGTRFGLELSSADASGNDAVFSTIDPRVQALAQQQLQRFQEGLAAAMDQMLAAVVQRGTGRAAAVVPDARGKTGTTNNGVDVVFIGYSPSLNLLTAIWMGNDDNKPAEAASGALVAELWGRSMQQVAARG